MKNSFSNIRFTQKGNGIICDSPRGQRTWIPLLAEFDCASGIEVEFESFRYSDDSGLAFLDKISKIVDSDSNEVLFEATEGSQSSDVIKLDRIRELVDRRVGQGAKQIKFRIRSDDAGWVFISYKGERSKHHGRLQITDDRDYPNNAFYGYVEKDGTWNARGPQAVIELVKLFNDNPGHIAKVVGKASGYCCFCSKELTKPQSIFAGYGATCASNYGLPWGELPEEDEVVNVADAREHTDGYRTLSCGHEVKCSATFCIECDEYEYDRGLPF